MKTGLVVGSGVCVWNDLYRLWKLHKHFDVVAVVNDMYVEWEDPVDYMVTLHPEKLAKWQAARAVKGLTPARITVANEVPSYHEPGFGRPNIDKVADYRFFSGQNGSGSSGMFATKVLLDEGFERVVLAGVPMQGSQKHFNSKDDWSEVDLFTKAWLQAEPFLRGKVKSMSGWTQELLGEPDQHWLSDA